MAPRTEPAAWLSKGSVTFHPGGYYQRAAGGSFFAGRVTSGLQPHGELGVLRSSQANEFECAILDFD